MGLSPSPDGLEISSGLISSYLAVTMQACFRVSVLFAVIALVWPAGLRAEGPAVKAPIPPRLAATVHEFQQLDRQQQAVWLSKLFARRSIPACRIAYPAAEVGRQQQRHQAIVQRVQAGRQFKTEGLVRVLSEVDRQERAAINRLWRDFEFGTAQAFHQQRAEFEKRMDARRAVLQRWLDAGQPWQQQPALIRWLQAAVAQQQKDPRLALPAMPSFSSSGDASIAETETPSVGHAETQPRSATVPPISAPPKPKPAAGKVARPAAPPSGSAGARPMQTTAARAGQQARVDLGELQARLTGYNLSVANLVSQLHNDEPWSAERLDAALDTLAELQTMQRDLNLYRNLLPAATRGNLSAIQSTTTAFALLSAKTASARRQLESTSARPSNDVQSELVRLERISHRLAQLATDDR